MPKAPLPPHLLKKMEQDPDVLDKNVVSAAVYRAVGVSQAQMRAVVHRTKKSQNTITAELLELCPVNTGYARAKSILDVIHPTANRILDIVAEALPGVQAEDEFTVFIYNGTAKKSEPKVWVVQSARGKYGELYGDYTYLVKGGTCIDPDSATQVNCAFTVTSIEGYLNASGITFDTIQSTLQLQD